MRFVSREEAAKLIDEELTRQGHCKCCSHRLSSYQLRVMRNYEYEHKLQSMFKEEFCITGWCPYNGKYCKWVDHAPKV